MKNYVFAVFLFFVFFSCKKIEELTLNGSVNISEETPIYNFDVQDVTGKDSVEVNKSVTYAVYIKQQTFYQSDQFYYIIWFPSASELEGTITYNGNNYRQGDIIGVSYDSIKNTNLLYFVYKPFSAHVGKYSLSFLIADRNYVTMNKVKKLKVYDPKNSKVYDPTDLKNL